MSKQTKIAIETAPVLNGNRPIRVTAWCAHCGKPVDWLTTDEAAMLARQSSRTIFHWVEAERLHTIESTQGLLFVCLNSLFNNLH